MDKFPTSEKILASTVHRPSVEIRLLAGIYDLLRELVISTSVPESHGDLQIAWRRPQRPK